MTRPAPGQGRIFPSGTIHNANGVEQVCPFHDRDLADCITTLPTTYKTRGRGFGVPFVVTMRPATLSHLKRAVLTDSST